MKENKIPIDALLAEKVARLELHARMIADGLLAGLHRAKARGFNVEFLEHREYYPGDDLKHVDWKVFARSGDYLVKQHEEERNLDIIIIIDASSSMMCGSDTSYPKWEHTQLIAAALSYIFIKQGDSIGLDIAGFGSDRTGTILPPASSKQQLYRIYSMLTSIQPDGNKSIAQRLSRVAEQSGKKNMIILISDLLDDSTAIMKALRVVGARGGESVIFHVLSEQELLFPFSKVSNFIDPESNKSLATDPKAIRNIYMKNLEKFIRDFRAFSGASGVDYVKSSTDIPVDEILLSYLEKRLHRKKRR